LRKINTLISKGITHKPGQSITRKILSNAVVRFADDFLVICNDETQVISVYNNIKSFLTVRGLKINETKTKKLI
jgi:hypothetical protein